MKRNKFTAVVLSESDYQRPLAARGSRIPGLTAMEWLLAHPQPGRLGKRQLDRRLREARDR
jgi:hypothetical protein